jgi:hypothetical protein
MPESRQVAHRANGFVKRRASSPNRVNLQRRALTVHGRSLQRRAAMKEIAAGGQTIVGSKCGVREETSSIAVGVKGPVDAARRLGA